MADKVWLRELGAMRWERVWNRALRAVSGILCLDAGGTCLEIRGLKSCALWVQSQPRKWEFEKKDAVFIKHVLHPESVTKKPTLTLDSKLLTDNLLRLSV